MATKVLLGTCLFILIGVLINGIQSDTTGHMLAANDFAIDLYNVLTENGKGNLFYSPYSIYTALGMTMVGAGGNTLDEMMDTLNWQDFVQDDMKNNGHLAFKNFNKLITSKTTENQKLSFSIANKLWLQKYFTNSYMKKYSSRLRMFYDTEVGKVNFANNPEGARGDINRWVAKKTNDKIKDLIKSGDLTPLTRLVLTNAIHFLGSWKTRFDAKQTMPITFTVDDKTSGKVPMMYVKSKFGYTENDICKVLELPYAGERMSMVLFVPRRGKSLTDLENVISAGVLKQMINRLVVSEVSVRIPKFKLESTLQLNENLKKLGIHNLFDADKADLSNITGVKGLYISAVVHKAFVDVDEKGTEAAAATAVIATFRSINPNRKVVIADRPFFFTIRDTRTGALIFVGKVVNPL